MVSHCRGSSTAEPSEPATPDAKRGLCSCAGEPPSTHVGTRQPRPQLIWMSQLRHYNADLDLRYCCLLSLISKRPWRTADPPRSAPPVQKGIHMLCPQQASLKEYHRPGLTTEIPQKSVLNFAILLGEETPRTVLKTQKMSFKT